MIVNSRTNRKKNSKLRGSYLYELVGGAGGDAVGVSQSGYTALVQAGQRGGQRSGVTVSQPAPGRTQGQLRLQVFSRVPSPAEARIHRPSQTQTGSNTGDINSSTPPSCAQIIRLCVARDSHFGKGKTYGDVGNFGFWRRNNALKHPHNPLYLVCLRR